ncbi:alpha/beta fold hydrolase [Aldersonia kunmingensis]|uniref:alpha/beta fold hydrolase n=1 Tax=Aldersonia kunmingensis TaxID=408066 RepID=UPI00082D1314|nr:alpha/beta fold hydrolase [Aldersonia kunmingensis]
MTDVAPRTRSETSALTALALAELGGAVGGIGNIHRAVSDRIFAGVRRGIGDSATPVQLAHDGISGAIYALVAGSAKATGAAAGHLLDLGYEERVRPSESPRGTALLGILQGLRGDALEVERSPLATPMSIRVNGRPIAPTATDLSDAYPHASGTIVVFLHGLCETERAWRLGGRPTYGERLAHDLGVTPVEIRFNTGRHISANGETLSQLLAALIATWPVEVERLALVGHSMGGLVARSACHRADAAGEYWVRRVHQIVCLGSPHYGAPLERIVHYAGAALNLLPESRPIGRLLRRRSAGIRDLRGGSLVDEDWHDRDPEALFTAACREVPLLDGVMHCFVSAGIVASERNPLGAMLGDGLVLVPSASGRSGSRRIGFRDEDGAHLPSANHFTLLNHDAVYGYLREWLSGPTILRK